MIRYPRFYRTVPEITKYLDPYVEVVKMLKWKKVAVIYYDDDFTLNVCGNCVHFVDVCVCVCVCGGGGGGYSSQGRIQKFQRGFQVLWNCNFSLAAS